MAGCVDGRDIEVDWAMKDYGLLATMRGLRLKQQIELKGVFDAVTDERMPFSISSAGIS